MKPLWVAVDGGARETLAPLAAAFGSALMDVSAHATETDAHWTAAIASHEADRLVVGTSDSARGRAVEGAARRAARQAGLAIVAIEDFPGNYYDVAGGAASVVLVESAAAKALYLEKFGEASPRVEIAVPARYDPYRVRLAELRRRTTEGWASASAKPTVLWAGQPETDDGVSTLQALLPLARKHGVELLFKAHPRDAGYAAGAYRALLSSSGVVSDVTQASVETALAAAPRLVVTQFSSIAIEAGFFGVPSLWVLLPEAGGARLRQKKGYAVPPLCLAGGAAHAADERSLARTFAQALGDIAYRENLMRCFDDYYGVHETGTAAALALLRAAAGSK